MRIKARNLRVVRLGKVTGTYIIYVLKLNRQFLCTPRNPRHFSLRDVLHEISYLYWNWKHGYRF